MNYFIKLLFLVNETSTLLYGFCAKTEQPVYDWNRKEIDKKLWLIQYTAIVTELQKKKFKQDLLSKAPIKIKQENLVFDLEPRPTVLSDTADLEVERNNPVSRFHMIDEYWNLNKFDLMKKINGAFSKYNGRELKNQIQNLFCLLKKECGIDFTLDGGRLGNFEFYLPGKYIDSFEIIPNKEDNCQVTLKKKESIPEALIVNCSTENEGRCISDELKIFLPKIEELHFQVAEPITRIRVKIWEQDTGDLVFADEISYIVEINVDMSTTTHRIIQDPWSQELFRSDSKNKSDIQMIEKNIISSKYHTLNISIEEKMPWRLAKQEGKKLCGVYKVQKVQGAFVPKTSDKKGEIDSFQKVRSYINEKGLEKIVLADPYFSVKSAAKLLGRISSASVKLNIITALSTKDPDTEKDNPEVKNQVRKFLKNNSNFLHSNLIIWNVLRETKQAFHDRYLVRYYENGKIDGFLLSNSLNSAGQSFPFVIAPLENEVCLEVADYLQKLIDAKFQKSQHKTNRAQIEVLYDSSGESRPKDNTPIISDAFKLPYVLSEKKDKKTVIEDCIALNFFKEDSTMENFVVLPEALPEIVTFINHYWNSNPESAVIALGEVMYHTYQGVDVVRNCLEDRPGAISNFLVLIPKLAEEMEQRQNHVQQPVYSEQYIFWAIMNEKAQPSSINHWFGLSPVYYNQEGYWYCLYKLFLHIEPVTFFRVIENTTSPLMLSILLNYLAFSDYKPDIYQLLLHSKWPWMKDLAAEWIWNNYSNRKHEFESILDTLEPEIQLEQSTYILSQAAFNARMIRADALYTTKENAQSICISLIQRIVKLCNGQEIPIEIKLKALEKVTDCEETSNCWLKISIARSLNDLRIRNFLSEKIISVFMSKISANHVLPVNPVRDKQFIEYVVEAILLRTEDINDIFDVAKILPWEALFDSTEPYLVERDYFRWSNAENKVKWTRELMNIYIKKGNVLHGKMKQDWDYFNGRVRDLLVTGSSIDESLTTKSKSILMGNIQRD